MSDLGVPFDDMRPLPPGGSGSKIKSMNRIRCPKCGEEFALAYDPPSSEPETLEIRSCTSGGVYAIRIRCPKCGHEEEIK
jgi:rRNA maturation protein Nop10